MHPLHGAAQFPISSIRARRLAANRVVEDEHAGCASSEMISRIDQSELKDYVHVLEQLLRLGVITALNLLIINKLLLIRTLSVDLEATAIKSVLILSTSHIAHSHGMDCEWSTIGLWTVNVGRMRWRAIFVGLVVVQHSVDILGPSLGGRGRLGGLWGVCRS
jgi:hypothetical protein